MICNNCGKEISKGKKFCTNCGQELNIKENLITGITVSTLVSIFVCVMNFLLIRYSLAYDKMVLYNSWCYVDGFVIRTLLIFINIICYSKIYKSFIKSKSIIISVIISFITASFLYFIIPFILKTLLNFSISINGFINLINVINVILIFIPLFKIQEIIYFIKNNYAYIKSKENAKAL